MTPTSPAKAFHWRMIDILIRVGVPFLMLAVTGIGGVVISNQQQLADIDGRLKAVESRTSMMPPSDYRSYIDAKFEALNDRLDELHDEMNDVLRRRED